MIEVAAGILSDANDRVLLMQRLPGKHLAGLWEFPGGKLEPGETVEQALTRELHEELGVEAHAFAPVISIPWRYPEKAVRLQVLRVNRWTGEPHAREGHPLRWVAVRDIDTFGMPAADVPVVAALRLPAWYVISGGEKAGSRFSPSSRGLPGGEGRGEARMIAHALYQLRLPGASREIVQGTAAAWLASEPELRGCLLLNHDIELARELGVGVHLRAAQLRELRQRPLPAGAWVGASCHDANELELAGRLGADFATLSPVRATASHPDASPIGWAHFARLVADARHPVYALGGVGPEDLATARAAGAQGVAGIRAFLRTL